LLALWQPKTTAAVTVSEFVKIHLDEDPKAGITQIAAIAASGNMVPLFLAARKTTNLGFGDDVKLGKIETKSEEKE
jgi:hypothetical protein